MQVIEERIVIIGKISKIFKRKLEFCLDSHLGPFDNSDIKLGIELGISDRETRLGSW